MTDIETKNYINKNKGNGTAGVVAAFTKADIQVS